MPRTKAKPDPEKDPKTLEQRFDELCGPVIVRKLSPEELARYTR